MQMRTISEQPPWNGQLLNACGLNMFYLHNQTFSMAVWNTIDDTYSNFISTTG